VGSSGVRGGIAALFGIDMETDVGSWTPEWSGLLRGTPRLLDLFDARDLRATFFFTAESAREHPEVVRAVRDRGHEVGCHSLYHETVGEAMFPLPGVHPLLPTEVAPRLDLATRIVEEAAGVRPVSFRAPRLWGSTAMVNALEGLGYLADLTYPLFFHRKQYAPYHPSPADWREQGAMRILEVPNFADMSMESRDPHGRDRDQWPLLRTHGAAALLGKAEHFVSLVRGKGLPPVLSFYFHPWEFVPMKAVYAMSEASITFAEFLTVNTGDAAVAALEALITGLRGMGARFTTARELAETGERP
jgi:peptidoglycan-N-acetylglucosamine deacetylase